MKRTMLELKDGAVDLMILGNEGPELLYLHGFADIHAMFVEPAPFHQRLSAGGVVIAPAHPGCSGSQGGEIDSIEDLVFHYIQLLDALGVGRIALVGNCFGGWIASEIAVRYPERVDALGLIASLGLLVPGVPTADLFMLSQPKDWGDMTDLRRLLFGVPESVVAQTLVPDGGTTEDRELLRFQALTFASRIGWRPPYFYNRKLGERLERISCPTCIIWGSEDRMVSTAHAETFAHRIPGSRLEIVSGAGHAVHLEEPSRSVNAISELLGEASVRK